MRYYVPGGKRERHVNKEYDGDPRVIEMLKSYDWKALYAIPDSLQKNVDRILENLPDHIPASKSNVRARSLQRCRRMIINSKKRSEFGM